MKHLEEFSVKKRQQRPPIPVSGTPLVDTHCHLDMNAYHADIGEILQNAFQQNVRIVISIGIDVNSSIQAVELARRHPMVSATVGIHPHDVDNITDRTFLILADLVEKNKEHIVGYGEIGLDYAKRYSTPENQRKHFRNQLTLADELGLPVIIHDRDAHEDILMLLREAGPLKYGGVMHCFSGDYGFAGKILDLGLHISIPGTVTFNNADLLQEVARKVPLSSLLLETDGPFLAPHPYRGKRNEPLFLLYTAQAIAGLRNISIEELARQTTLNAVKLFGLHLATPQET
jgi:TatD DNase family protein